MLITPHLLVGALIGKEVGNIWLVIILAILSHYLLDAIPHYKMSRIKAWEKGSKDKLDIKELLSKAIEPVIGISLAIYFVLVNHSWAMFIGAFFAFSPDILVFLHWKYAMPYPPGINYFEKNLHKHIGFFSGIISQVLVSVLAIILITHL